MDINKLNEEIKKLIESGGTEPTQKDIDRIAAIYKSYTFKKGRAVATSIADSDKLLRRLKAIVDYRKDSLDEKNVYLGCTSLLYPDWITSYRYDVVDKGLESLKDAYLAKILCATKESAEMYMISAYIGKNDAARDYIISNIKDNPVVKKVIEQLKQEKIDNQDTLDKIQKEKEEKEEKERIALETRQKEEEQLNKNWEDICNAFKDFATITGNTITLDRTSSRNTVAYTVEVTGLSFRLKRQPAEYSSYPCDYYMLSAVNYYNTHSYSDGSTGDEDHYSSCLSYGDCIKLANYIKKKQHVTAQELFTYVKRSLHCNVQKDTYKNQRYYSGY